MWFLREHRIVAGVILFDLIIVIVILIMMIVKAGKTAMVDILTVPSVAKVRIGGGEYESGAYKVYPGDYEVKVEAEGFVTKTVPVSMRNGEISKIYVYLEPEEDNLNYYAEHEDDWENMRLMSDEEAQRVYKLLSIQEVLPLEYVEEEDDGSGLIPVGYYRITEENDTCETYYCLKVASAQNKNEEVVRSMLNEKGFDLKDYGVIWKIYEGEDMDEALTKMREGEWGE